MEAEAFFEDLRQDVLLRADASEEFTEPTFAEVVTEYLVEAGSIEEFVPCSFLHRGVRIDGYSYTSDDGQLELYAVDYRHGDTPETMTKSEMDQAFRRAEAFFERSLTAKFTREMDASHPAYAIARTIFEQGDQITRVRFYLLTNAKLTSTVKALPSKPADGREWSYRVWDLARLAKTIGDGVPEEILVDFVEKFGKPLVCLPAGNNSDVRCYLSVIPGTWLASIYDEYGGRLLEQNVRTFLQVKGKVNKGIRKTITDEPHRFFPYNNGISATAEAVEEQVDGGVCHVTRIRNLQIVNGGQTTASIFDAMKKDKALSPQIHVQMKLSVVRPEVASEIVPKISQYANSQNKVSDSDFFSNHPFHVVMENISRRVAAPATDGSQILTYWFYERAKGQHANAQAYLSSSKKKAFLLQNPKSQVIQKTDLAKYVQTFNERPVEVSSGAQKNFAKFAAQVGSTWQAKEFDYNEHWFKRAVVEAIIFRALEKAILRAPWYNNGYRAQTVTYAISLFMNRIRAKGYELDVQRVWREQDPGQVLLTELLECCRLVQDELITGADSNGVANVTEWCKRKGCWDGVLALDYTPSQAVLQILRSSEEERADVRDARRDSKEVSVVEAQIAVVNAGAKFWQAVKQWAVGKRLIRPSDMKLLEVASAIPKKLPSDRDSVRLLEIRAMFESDD